jgi:hypothetical protein
LKITEIEEFINSIDSSEIRQIIECRFLNGLSWNDTAKVVYGFAGESTPRMALKRFLDKK